MRFKKLLLILLFPLFFGGCIIPIPLPPASDQFTKEMEKQIEVGKTTKNEVIALLGESSLPQNDRLSLYRLPRESMKFLVIAVGPGAGGAGLFPVNRQNYVLLMEFDTSGVLNRYEYDVQSFFTPEDPDIITTKLSYPKETIDKRKKILSADVDIPLLFFSTTSRPVGFSAVSFSPDGNRLAAGGYLFPDDSKIINIYLKDLETDTVKVVKLNEPAGHILFSPNLAKTAVNVGGTISIIDTNTSEQLFKGHPHNFFSGRYSSAMAFNPNGDLIATANNAGDVTVWNAQSNQELFSISDAHKYEIASIAFSQDGRWLATTSGVYEKNIKLWNAKTGTLVHTINTMGFLKFSPTNDDMFAINCNDHVELWKFGGEDSNQTQLTDIFLLPQSDLYSNLSLEFSKDGNWNDPLNVDTFLFVNFVDNNRQGIRAGEVNATEIYRRVQTRGCEADHQQ